MSVLELRDLVGDVLDRVARGETVIVTRDGVEIAELHGRRPRQGLSAAELIARRSHLPLLDPQAPRRDMVSTIDAVL